MNEVIGLRFHKPVSVSAKFWSLVFGPGMSFVGGITCPQASQTCCDTPFFGKDLPMSNFLFILRGCGGGDGPNNRYIRLGSPSD